MITNLLKQGALIEKSDAIGTVTRGMIRGRAVELALINGRFPQEVSNTEWNQAKRELTGDTELEPKQVLLESVSESERWDPIYGSVGHKIRKAPSDDEDDEGLSDSACSFKRRHPDLSGIPMIPMSKMSDLWFCQKTINPAEGYAPSCP